MEAPTVDYLQNCIQAAIYALHKFVDRPQMLVGKPLCPLGFKTTCHNRETTPRRKTSCVNRLKSNNYVDLITCLSDKYGVCTEPSTRECTWCPF